MGSRQMVEMRGTLDLALEVNTSVASQWHFAPFELVSVRVWS